MTACVRALAPAKVNLHLDVRGQRPDGYHELLSLFQMVSLCDELSFTFLAEDGACQIETESAIAPGENIVRQAVDLFRKETGDRRGVHVKLAKRIPVGAGMGGGSSDAATTLLALTALLGRELDKGVLPMMAERLGSDVPFFLGGAAALVSGRGERVEPLAARADFRLAVAIPPFSISTRDAFGWLDAAPQTTAASLTGTEIRTRYHALPPNAWGFFNSFDPVVGERYPEIKRIRDRFREAGAGYTAVTGSGSAVIAVFTKEDDEARILAAGRASGVAVISIAPLAKQPELEYSG